MYYVLVAAGFELLVVNAVHMKKVPGRKTDQNNAAWLAVNTRACRRLR